MTISSNEWACSDGIWHAMLKHSCDVYLCSNDGTPHHIPWCIYTALAVCTPSKIKIEKNSLNYAPLYVTHNCSSLISSITSISCLPLSVCLSSCLCLTVCDFLHAYSWLYHHSSIPLWLIRFTWINEMSCSYYICSTNIFQFNISKD